MQHLGHLTLHAVLGVLGLRAGRVTRCGAGMLCRYGVCASAGGTHLCRHGAGGTHLCRHGAGGAHLCRHGAGRAHLCRHGVCASVSVALGVHVTDRRGGSRSSALSDRCLVRDRGVLKGYI